MSEGAESPPKPAQTQSSPKASKINLFGSMSWDSIGIIDGGGHIGAAGQFLTNPHTKKSLMFRHEPHVSQANSDPHAEKKGHDEHDQPAVTKQDHGPQEGNAKQNSQPASDIHAGSVAHVEHSPEKKDEHNPLPAPIETPEQEALAAQVEALTAEFQNALKDYPEAIKEVVEALGRAKTNAEKLEILNALSAARR